MTMLGEWRARSRAPGVLGRARAYDVAPGDVAATQLDAWNHEWARLCRESPYYRAQSARLPRAFASWDEFLDRVPVLDRATLRERAAEMACASRPPDFSRKTGGSTAQPIQVPAWTSERGWTNDDLWWARSWYGVTPAATLFMLWGHSHLLGAGWRGWVNGRRRQLQDRVAGYVRWSAYDLRPDALRAAADCLLAFRPVYVIGYSVALDRFARVNADRAAALRGLGVKAVVAAAERFPFDDSVARVQEVFGAPVAMEYGSVETDLIAHTHPAGGYRVFWRSYYVEVEPTGSGDIGRVRVTSLYPRAVPLVRYEIGDEIRYDPARAATGLTWFPEVIGRCNDYVTLPGGSLIHSEAFSHVAREVPGVAGYQVVQDGPAIELRVLATAPVAESDVAEMRRRLVRIHPELAGVTIASVPELERTIAGKTRMVIVRGPR